ncbi:MAG: hypothetical protein DSY80_06725 [Desulfocapsa sp.]|nr:MAG: hypothetical protein DSY80_06725 [Desulfocapsa sp.]
MHSALNALISPGYPAKDVRGFFCLQFLLFLYTFGMEKEQTWFVYILQCQDKTLYTGITTNLIQRVYEHNHSPKGAKYTRGRRPVTLCYSEPHPSRSAAASREYQIKQLSRKQKKQLIGKLYCYEVDCS